MTPSDMNKTELVQEIERLQEELARSGTYFSAHANTVIVRLESELEQAKERERQLQEALTFYADPETYFAIGFFPDSPCGEFIDDFEDTELGRKPGKKARAALTVPPAKEQSTWQCGCGWTNGVDLAKCAMCGRTPAESVPPKQPQAWTQAEINQAKMEAQELKKTIWKDPPKEQG